MPSNLRDKPEGRTNELHDLLHHAIDHFAHILPAQASIRDFVHHNTLHGYQELKFQDALKASYDLTGAYGYWPQEKFRKAYLNGRITDDDIFQVLSKDIELDADTLLFKTANKKTYLRDIYKVACLFPLKNITSCQLRWQIEESNALTAFQLDITEISRNALLNSSKKNEADSIEDLWAACIEVLELDHALLHPEELLDLEAEQVERIFAKVMKHQALASTDNSQEQSVIDTLIQKQARKQMDDLLSKVGTDMTMGGLLKKVTGINIQREITPHLLPYLANWLDEGFAKWHANLQEVEGFYQHWKQSAAIDETGLFSEIPDWKEHIDSLPNNAIDTVIEELRRMSIPKNRWGDYITRLALELPGWSGMFYWRHTKPEYPTSTNMQVDMMDYLAVRLVLEHIYVRKYCRRNWLVGGDMAALAGYLHQHYAEFFVRNALLNQVLPEYLKTLAQNLAMHNARRDALTMHQEEWKQLAHMVWTWQQSPAADISLSIQSSISLKNDDSSQESINKESKEHRGAQYHHDGWKLFRLAQHLGLSAKDILKLNESQLDDIFHCIKRINKHTAGFILLQAYEIHYQNQLFTTITRNQGRGTWANREKNTPEAQVFFCMDDREEGIRRHLEHLNPNIETLGSAAFFNIVLGWKALESDEIVSLCPVVVTPTHEIEEVADSAYIDSIQKYKQQFNLISKFRNSVHQRTHQGLFSTSILMTILAPATLLTLLGKNFLPLEWNRKLLDTVDKFKSKKVTRIETTAHEIKLDASITDKQHGFTVQEQTDIVERFMQDNGLLKGLAPLIVIMGHYSRNQNNPHTAAYGCGACGGKFSGPNGRVFAAMANHPEVREQLQARGIDIPETSWFVGAEHDTCNENIILYDKDLIPERLLKTFDKLTIELNTACQHSAQERCRKLASAPKNPSLIDALKHIAGRAVDFSQARPELGHATIATGFVGRRYMSQGTFMDRRSFLISYDSNVDADGDFLERLLLSVGPVGAGINLEYYFSSVNNEHYGSGSKIVHNLSGKLGVLEGASGDLRTGLPIQMIEIHEPMRLQLMIEAKTEVLTRIYQDQPSIQQLVGNGWLILSAKDPDSEEIQTFDPIKGWQVWRCPESFKEKLSTVKSSVDLYRDQYDHLPPALIEIPTDLEINVGLETKASEVVSHA